MPKKIGKIWTPIDTSNQQEVEKHPRTATFQRLRNKMLTWSVNLKSARIEIPIRKGQHGPTADRVNACLQSLGKDLGNASNRIDALNAIGNLVRCSDNWNDSLTLALPTKAKELQQLRMNVQLLFTKYTIIEERAFLEAVYKKSDARLAGPKGYYHVDLVAPLPAQTPAPTVAAAPLPVAAAPPDVPPPNDPPPPPPEAVQIEEHILDVIDRDLANSAAAAPSQRAEGAPLPSDAPPPLPAVEVRQKTIGKENEDDGEVAKRGRRGEQRVLQHRRYATEVPKTKDPILPVGRRTSLDLDQLNSLLDVELTQTETTIHSTAQFPPIDRAPESHAIKPVTVRSPRGEKAKALDHPSVRPRLMSASAKPPEQKPQTPRTAPPAPVEDAPIGAAPVNKESKPETGTRTIKTSQRVLSRQKLVDTSGAVPLEKRTEPRDDGDPDAAPPRGTVGSTRVTPPHWFANFRIRSEPKERADDLAQCLLRAIEEKKTVKSDNFPILYFLNRLADPALAEFIPGAIKNAVDGRMLEESKLRYVRTLMDTIDLRQQDWKQDLEPPKAQRLEAILGIWKTFKEAAPVLHSEEERTLMTNREWVIFNLKQMELRPPAPARRAVQPMPRNRVTNQ
jgi:hypothetical protein